MGGKLNADDILFVIRAVSVVYGLSAVACTCTGIFTLWYAAPVMSFPISSASGIWTGVCTFVIFVLGIRTAKLYELDYPVSSKGRVIAFYTFVIIDITLASLHISFSAVGFSHCSKELRTGGTTCNKEERPRLLLMESFNIAFGVIIALVSLSMTIYLSLRKRINFLVGVPEEETVKVTCCGGLCTCRTGSYY